MRGGLIVASSSFITNGHTSSFVGREGGGGGLAGAALPLIKANSSDI